jgi:hypothetical protein
MKASYLGAMGYSQRQQFPAAWPIPPIYHDPETSVRSYQEGIEECEFAEEMGFGSATAAGRGLWTCFSSSPASAMGVS